MQTVVGRSASGMEDPMRFDDSRVDTSRVSDRRGRGLGGGRVGPGVALGGGGGVIGLVVLLIMLFTGNDPTGGSFAVPDSGESQSDVEERCNASDEAIFEYDDCFAIKVTNEIDEIWSAEFARRGSEYTRPQLVLFEQAVQTGCGAASSNVGPFYCPPDQGVYIDLQFMERLQQQLGAQGQYAKAYILAHEVGHHLQTLLGTERQVRQAQQQDPSRTNELSVSLELQADCYAGVWSTLANQAGNLAITEAELDQAIGAAEAVGDDAIQSQGGGQVNPDSFTHGSSEQRRSWFLTGYQSADIESCDTFD
jgi:predicted metalloprotease